MTNGLVQELTRVFQLPQPVCRGDVPPHPLADRLLKQFA